MKYKICIATAVLILGCGPSEKEIKLEKELAELKKQQEHFTVNGNVFIVTKGGENLKLGLVPIAATPIKNFDDAKTNAIAIMFDFYQKNVTNFLELKNKYFLENELHESLALKHEQRRAKIYEYITTASKTTPDVHVYPTIKKITGGMYGNRNRAEKILSELNLLIDETNKVYEEMLPIEKRMTQIKKEILEIITAKNGMEETRARSFIKSLYKDSIATQSDADGNFKLKLDRGKQYVLIGLGQRTVGEKDENYNWMKLIKTPSTDHEISVLLSNDSLIENIPGDEFVMRDLNRLEFSHYISSPGVQEHFKLE